MREERRQSYQYVFSESRQINRLYKINNDLIANLSYLLSSTKQYCGSSSLPTYLCEAMYEAKECLQRSKNYE